MGKSIDAKPANDKQKDKRFIMSRQVECQKCGSHYSERLGYCPYYGCNVPKFKLWR